MKGSIKALGRFFGGGLDALRNLSVRVWRILREDRLPRIFAVFLVVIMITGTVAALVEHFYGNPMYTKISDGLWWAVVTMTTVGYGDKTPVTAAGRLLAVIIMFSGIGFSALFTAIVASYFVEKRIREGKGMEQINLKRHIVLCGWNSHAMRIVQKLTEKGAESTPLVLVTDLPEEHVANILESTKGAQVKYVRGDFVHEGVLNRANVGSADVVVILADTYGSRAGSRPDNRTTLACFTARSINRQARICAEIESEENIAHLKRANVDTIIHTEAYNPFLIANAAVNPGVTVAVQDLLTWDHGHSIQQKKIPQPLHGRPYSEAVRHFREKENGLLIGLVSEEEEGMGLDDILSGDMSAIDKFIKKKFEGLEETYFTRRKRLNVKLNPPDNLVIKPNDLALIIGPEKDL